jgi:hypothetical protein
MYVKLLTYFQAKNPAMRLVGLSATCYRLDTGYLDRGYDKLFEQTVFEYGLADAIKDGWLCPITSKSTRSKILTSVGAAASSLPANLKPPATFAPWSRARLAKLSPAPPTERTGFASAPALITPIRCGIDTSVWNTRRSCHGRYAERGTPETIRRFSRRRNPLSYRLQCFLHRVRRSASRPDRDAATDTQPWACCPASRARDAAVARQGKLSCSRLCRKYPAARPRRRAARIDKQPSPTTFLPKCAPRPGRKRPGRADVLGLRPRVHY